MKYEVIDTTSGTLYTMQFKEYVEKENINDSYMLWNIELNCGKESLVFSHIHYLYLDSLENSLLQDNFKLVK